MEEAKKSIPSLFQVTEVELVYRNKTPAAERKTIQSASAAYDILMSVWDMNKIELVEQFKIILLDTSSKCLGISEIASGGISSCVVDPRIVFSTALMAKASSIILAHNHPSGNLTPSKSDIHVTEQLIECGKFLEIKVSDHLIVTPRDYYSINSHDALIFSM